MGIISAIELMNGEGLRQFSDWCRICTANRRTKISLRQSRPARAYACRPPDKGWQPSLVRSDGTARLRFRNLSMSTILGVFRYPSLWYPLAGAWKSVPVWSSLCSSAVLCATGSGRAKYCCDHSTTCSNLWPLSPASSLHSMPSASSTFSILCKNHHSSEKRLHLQQSYHIFLWQTNWKRSIWPIVLLCLSAKAKIGKDESKNGHIAPILFWSDTI